MIDPELAGKVVLVTGANNPRGIGAAIARAFARLGCPVYLQFLRGAGESPSPDATPGEALYRQLNAQTADAVVDDIHRAGGRADAWEVDLSDGNQIAPLLDRVETAVGPVDVLVNNAAHCDFDTFLATRTPVFGVASTEQASPLTAAIHDAHVAINSRAPALLMAEYARRAIDRAAGWGRIVNVSTDAADSHPGAVSYGASKHALESYSRAAAYELGRHGITVNVVAPGPIQTGWITPALEAEVVQRTPLGRVGLPEDVADVVVFLASTQGRWVTGQTLYVGGGHVMPR